MKSVDEADFYCLFPELHRKKWIKMIESYDNDYKIYT